MVGCEKDLALLYHHCLGCAKAVTLNFCRWLFEVRCQSHIEPVAQGVSNVLLKKLLDVQKFPYMMASCDATKFAAEIEFLWVGEHCNQLRSPKFKKLFDMRKSTKPQRYVSRSMSQQLGCASSNFDSEKMDALFAMDRLLWMSVTEPNGSRFHFMIDFPSGL